MCHHIVRCTSNVFDPPPFTGVESLGFAPLSDKKYLKTCTWKNILSEIGRISAFYLPAERQ